MDILVSEDIKGKSIDALKERYEIGIFKELWKNPVELSEMIPGVSALIVRNQTKVNRIIIDSAESLKVIGRAGVGYDNIDVEYASQKGIVVCYTPDGNTISTAELTIGLMIALARKIPSGDKSTKAGKWDRFNHLGTELYNKKIGIVGFGKIGRTVAARVRSFGMEIMIYEKYANGNSTGFGHELKSLEELLSVSDFVTIHLPLSKETKNLFDYNKLKLMKPGSFLINTARGEIICENDLIRALEEDVIKGAALDVQSKEPPSKSKLNDFDNVILTPHVGGLTVESQERVIDSLARDIDLVLRGEQALNYVNFPLPKLTVRKFPDKKRSY